MAAFSQSIKALLSHTKNAAVESGATIRFTIYKKEGLRRGPLRVKLIQPLHSRRHGYHFQARQRLAY
jgi:hypothetical protein